MSGLTARIIGSDGNMGCQHAEAYESLGVRIVNGKADIVSIASPDHTHGDYVLDALEQGSHVFCEKPLCTSLMQLLEIKKASRDLSVGQNYPLRHLGVFKLMKKTVEQGGYGDIYRMELCYNWGRTHKLDETWRKGRDYSLVLGGMIHMIDLGIWMTGLDIVPVSVMGCNRSAPNFNGKDTVSALCRLTGGGICNATVDGGLGVRQHNHLVTIHGTLGGGHYVNKASADKQACIREFVENLRDGKQMRDFRAIQTALEINSWV